MTFNDWWEKVEELTPPEILVGCRDLAEDAWDYKEQQLTALRDMLQTAWNMSDEEFEEALLEVRDDKE